MLIALTHVLSPHIDRCELTFRNRSHIDYDRADEQHKAYCAMLRSAGLHVIELSINRTYPDSTFVEDTAVVVDELAIVARMGVESRRGEVRGIESELATYRETTRIQAPATLEGGDVLQVGRRIFVGVSPRTNVAGADALKGILGPHGYDVVPVSVRECLHLKSACTAIDDETVLVNRDWLDLHPFVDYKIVYVPEEEPSAANALRLGNTILMHAGFSRTIEVVQRSGYVVETVDISELLKAEAGMTCSSIIFQHPL